MRSNQFIYYKVLQWVENSKKTWTVIEEYDLGHVTDKS